MKTEVERDEADRHAIAQATEALSVLEAHTTKDPHRLGYHFMAPAAWMNDPNGMIYFKGEYHMFYQIHPYSADNGPKHWGHAKSADMVHWEHLPLALAPVEDYERGGCFSGTAVDDDGVFTLIYTGNAVENGVKKQTQCIAVSGDGIRFVKHDGNPVVGRYPADASPDFRDPKVWKHDGVWYMAVGSGKDGVACAPLYTSDDLRSWAYVGIMARSKAPGEGVVWNCPDFFSIGGKDVLVVSPAVWPGNLKEVRKTMYYIGRMDYETGVFEPETDGDIDFGDDFYAPQTLIDGNGRVILLGWMDMWFNPMPTKAYGWAGAMTLPREVILRPDGKLGYRPLAELESLREKRLHHSSHSLTSGSKRIAGADGAMLEIELVFDVAASDAGRFGLKVRQSANGAEETAVLYDRYRRELTVDRSRAGQVTASPKPCPVGPDPDGRLSLRVFLDRSSLEVFAGDGEAVMTSRIYPDGGSLGLSLFCEGGGASLPSLTVWQLASAAVASRNSSS
ncbi:glycoside hydrolase family 32 protein [Paenibacillus arenilitoris]|uniref:Sucrose-6-phosphate hydrolase n=1 Tax=Paenibacillus arenilitoris TaxID=2772299 RepID=A0A927H8X7_9BACL|nr:glycoside hydrolase family 32 protein [Paenibacillus arenilitoris]MBD2872525.1 glycoside hydrolase family 32 protein [Paenibacillus arenilitoris]